MDFDPAIGTEICELVAAGANLREALQLDQSRYPTARNFNRWVRENPEFKEEFQEAQHALADLLANEVIKIADTEEDPSRARVQIEARKWKASKLNPGFYGEKQSHEISGVRGGPIKIEGLWGSPVTEAGK